MPRTILHLGLHKTASTFLQTVIFPQVTNATYLGRPYTQLNHAFNQFQYADDSRYSREVMDTELARFDGDLLISDEMLSGVPNFNYMNRSVVAQRMAELWPDAEIILFLRGQDSMLQALHNSWVKNIGGTLPLNEFVHAPSDDYTYDDFEATKVEAGSFGADGAKHYYFHHDRFSLHLTNLNYFELVRLYEDLFPKVHVYLFEEFKEDAAGIVKRISVDTGLHFDIDELPTPVNQSIAGEHLNGWRWWNSFSALTKHDRSLWLARQVGRLSYRVRPDTWQLSELTAGFYRENNQRLAEARPDLPLDRYPNAYEL